MTTPLTVDAINAAVMASFPGSHHRCHEIGDGYAISRFTPDETSIRPGGYISGPTQFAAADAVLWYASFVALGRIEEMALTSELSIRFLRPAIGDVLWARGDVNIVTRRSIVGTVRVWCDDRSDKPTAIAQGTYAIPIAK
ncbi:MAG: PaaI family thioesterase [Actinomycetota bacterium]|nr:PaaI family thioesterase [Actinomycetota bacterium]